MFGVVARTIKPLDCSLEYGPEFRYAARHVFLARSDRHPVDVEVLDRKSHDQTECTATERTRPVKMALNIGTIEPCESYPADKISGAICQSDRCVYLHRPRVRDFEHPAGNAGVLADDDFRHLT